mmetsp:Transcript_14120/g.29282  ORF Transcript_14120/g.29282 Transcript_14120/m.29282 type:complete len:93 (+) Transcript_14120:1291-1569(+)
MCFLRIETKEPWTTMSKHDIRLFHDESICHTTSKLNHSKTEPTRFPKAEHDHTHKTEITTYERASFVLEQRLFNTKKCAFLVAIVPLQTFIQ